MPVNKKETGKTVLSARVLNPAGLADYQTGAIVSREIISRRSGTVTAFAFDKDEQLSEHTAPFDAMVLCLDGEAEILIGGKANRVKSGEMIIMPAGIPHALKAVRKFKMLLIMIKK